MRIALQFSLAYALATIVFGFALSWLDTMIPDGQMEFWLLAAMSRILPVATHEMILQHPGLVMMVRAILLTAANIGLVVALLFPILRWNLQRSGADPAEDST